MKNSSWLIIALLATAGFGFYYLASNKQESDNQKFLRNNWPAYITRNKFEYKYSYLGGIDAFNIPIENNTDFLVDEVIVSIDYIKAAGGVYKTEKVTISNIPPHSIKSARAPESPRGTSIDA